MQAFLPCCLSSQFHQTLRGHFSLYVSFLFLLPDRQIPYDKFFHLKSLTTLAPDGNDDTQFFQSSLLFSLLLLLFISMLFLNPLLLFSRLISVALLFFLSRVTVYTTSGKIQFSSRCLVHFLVFQFARFFPEKKLVRILPGILTLIVSQSGFIQSGKNIHFLAKNME